MEIRKSPPGETSEGETDLLSTGRFSQFSYHVTREPRAHDHEP